MYSQNDYWAILNRSAYLRHYGVMGMKWGVRKARQYNRDLNQHRRNKEVSSLKYEKNTGQMSKKDYKSAKKSANAKMKAANKSFKESINSSTPKTKKGAKASTIYEPHKRAAYKEIPSYGTKRGLRTGVNIIRGGMDASNVATIPLMAAMTAGVPGGQVILPAAIGATAVSSLLDRKIYNTISRKTM